MTSQWYHQGVVNHHHHHQQHGHHHHQGAMGVGAGVVPATPSYNYLMDTPSSNSREQRNKAEKQRRDKLNSFITELACLVPMVFNSPKRMDKTSILRLSATHLRIYQTLRGGSSPKLDVPKNVDQNIIENLVCDELNGFLLILTATGKVVFVSQTVETLLGHLQTDLMGQTIFTIAAPEDHDRLRLYITQSGSDPSTSTTNSQVHISDRDWRKYFNIRLKRAGPRSEPPVYESVNVMGMQRPSANAIQGGDFGTGTNGGAQTAPANSDMWVFFVRIYRPEVITNMLMEASKDEYVTRHYVDGRIIDCDQRISLIAGYMIEEINGLSAFNFMHKEDVHWVIVALRQMYDRGESRGNSCYRLQSKTGQFIYLRTVGWLEADSTGTVETFICVNSLVSEREGMLLNREMKERYSALVNSGSNSPLTITELEDNGVEAVEDPKKVEVAIENLLHNLPTEADLTYQELISSTEKRVKTEPMEYVNYNQIPADHSSTTSNGSSNGNAHSQPQGVKRPAAEKSVYNNSAKQRKVTKLLMRPASNPSSQQAIHRTTPTQMLCPSPTVQPNTTPPIFIKQEPEPQSPNAMEPQSPQAISLPVQMTVNMGGGASPGGVVMPPTPLTPSMDHSYPYRPQISPGSNNMHQSTSRILLSPPMSNSSHTSNISALSPSNSSTYSALSPQQQQESNLNNRQAEVTALLGQETEAAITELERVAQYNGGAGRAKPEEMVSGRENVR